MPFLETYYFVQNGLEIYCISRGMCINYNYLYIDMLLYARNFICIAANIFSLLLIAYLFAALGFCTNPVEVHIRDLDEFGIHRPKTVSIYDFVHTYQPYYTTFDPEFEKQEAINLPKNDPDKTNIESSSVDPEEEKENLFIKRSISLHGPKPKRK